MIITILQSPVSSLKETGSRLALRFKMGHLTPDMSRSPGNSLKIEDVFS